MQVCLIMGRELVYQFDKRYTHTPLCEAVFSSNYKSIIIQQGSQRTVGFKGDT